MTNVTVEHIIAKIDNDFNPDNSDWIPRVAAWCTDAMNQLKLLQTNTKKYKIEINNRIGKIACCNLDIVKVYDANGCEIKQVGSGDCCNGSLPTGGVEDYNSTESCNPNGSGTREVLTNNGVVEDIVIAEHVNTIVEKDRHNVYSIKSAGAKNRNYVISGNTIELNYNTSYVVIEANNVQTTYSNYYKCEIPVIPNNGLLTEALAYYCMYKMLCRGYKHPVFNLNASQYGTNPYYMWTQLKDKAKASTINDSQGDDNGEWRNFFINSMIP